MRATFRSGFPRIVTLVIVAGFVPFVLGVGCPGPGETVQNIDGQIMDDSSSAGQTTPDDSGEGPADEGTGQQKPASVPGDLNGDGAIGQADFDILAASFGRREGDPLFNPAADLNGDGIVALDDFQILDGLAKGNGG